MEQLAHHVGDALQLALWLSLPALAAAVIAGLVTGLLQAATQVQDPALSFVPRLLAVSVALIAGASVMQAKLVAFAGALLRELPQWTR